MIKQSELHELLEIATSLEGEEAIAQVWRFFECPADMATGELALHATMRFYANVRYLAERVCELSKKGGEG